MSGSKRKGWNKEKVAYGMKQKNIEDLTWEVIRIAKETMPKVIVCENVKGLTMEYAADHFQKMIKDTEALGYTTTYKVLRGHDYGVPQKRERIFMVSVRDDVVKDVGLNFMTMSTLFPEPEEHEPTVREAIEDLQDDPKNKEEAKELTELMRTSSKGKWIYGFDTHPDYPNSGPCKGLKGVDYNNKVVSIGDNVVGPWFKEQVAKGVIKPEDEKHSYYMSRIVPWDQAAHSLTEQGLQPKFMGGNHMHPDEYRVYTPTEAKRIMSLPEDYKLTGTIDQKQARIGLMVAPLCMKYLADSIYEKVIKVFNEIHKN
jgi:DNA (cytosine-5)-methyltransferase 1